MTLAFKRIMLYAKLALIIAAVLIVFIAVLKNRDNVIIVWFFREYQAVNVLWLIACTAVSTVLSWWILSATVGVWRDLRGVYNATQAQRREEALKQREAKLVEAEERIDRKLKGAAEGEDK